MPSGFRHSRTGWATGRIICGGDRYGMRTFHKWLTMREGLWLNDKNAAVGMSNINPLLQKKAKVKRLKLPKEKLGVGLK